jgi:hypothetical protein
MNETRLVKMEANRKAQLAVPATLKPGAGAQDNRHFIRHSQLYVWHTKIWSRQRPSHRRSPQITEDYDLVFQALCALCALWLNPDLGVPGI